MFGMGWPEMFVIGVVALLVFGPDKLPDLARQAGRFVRTVKQMAENAKEDLGRELGHDFSGLEFRDLDPREVVRRSLLDDEPAPKTPVQKPLGAGEKPPFDSEST
ncbi:sec-independent translocase [Aeromicrobium sp.]